MSTGVAVGQWSTGLGFDGPTKKACPVVGLSRPMDKPAAKCGNCRRELRESNISRLYIEWVKGAHVIRALGVGVYLGPFLSRWNLHTSSPFRAHFGHEIHYD